MVNDVNAINKDTFRSLAGQMLNVGTEHGAVKTATLYNRK